jgi:cytochrome c oxidase subunit 3
MKMAAVTEPVAPERELNSLSIVTVIVVLFIVTTTFGALIAAFLVRSGTARYWQHIELPSLLWLTTAVLVASSATLELGRKRLERRDQQAFRRLTLWTAILGVLFLAGQIAAWFQMLHAGVVLTNNPHSWFIFLFSGLHGLHILGGLAGLGYLLMRTWRPAGGPKYQMKTRAIATGVSIFWHYLDFVWLVLFLLLLGWRR